MNFYRVTALDPKTGQRHVAGLFLGENEDEVLLREVPSLIRKNSPDLELSATFIAKAYRTKSGQYVTIPE